ncbi:hypothetical protein NDU88_008165 [Pleurodeles waltl]|uniref:Uncharacterized protein n=1 Tax=Pleurodeles waltl TaxID=8319 RepID=A0AAV7N5S8_PLEWA|nr:hypothetical protein NDU88_008165 [Pleurodeles waltl]
MRQGRAVSNNRAHARRQLLVERGRVGAVADKAHAKLHPWVEWGRVGEVGSIRQSEEQGRAVYRRAVAGNKKSERGRAL